MYESCFAGADDMLRVIVVVLFIVCAGLIAAIRRETASARKWRHEYRHAQAEARAFKRERDDARVELMFPDRQPLRAQRDI